MTITGLLVIVLLALAAPAHADERVLWIRNAHTGSEYKGAPFGPAGLVRRAAWSRLGHLFADPRARHARRVHPRLLGVLAQVERHFGGRRIDLYSGYRIPGDGAERNSYHQVAHAADVRIDGVAPRTLFEYCRSLSRLGCGLYPNAAFVHIDVRGSKGVWVDLGAADYVSDPDRWLEEHPAAGLAGAPSAPALAPARRRRGGTP